ncbi:MAG: 50S ribosomal protein L24e [Candidatus Thermoplasmatota archaeon]|nr:50S ribosomal protein L24e [Candidatus Thermoplasmatota archaeon]
MVTKRKCTFCGEEIEPGTGSMYVKKDGTVYYFCSSKCRKNFLKFGREPRRVRWTKRFSR